MLTADGPEGRSSSTCGSAIPKRRSCCRCSTKICRGCSARRRPARCRRGRRDFATSRTSASCSPRAAIPEQPETGKPIDGLDAAAAVPGALVFHAGTSQARRPARDRRRPRADRRRPRRDAIATRSTSRIAAASRIQLRRHAVPARHRPEGARRSQSGPLKYAVVTFGCRVNQADSLAIEGELRARGAVSCAARRGGPGRRQHLLGDGDRRSGRAADDPPHRAQQPRRARSSSPAATRRGAPTSLRELPNVAHRRSESSQGRSARRRWARRPAAIDRGALRRRRWTVRRAARARRRRSDGVHAARADRMRGALQLLHHSATRGAGRSRPLDEVTRRDRRAPSPPATGRSRSPACTSARTAATCATASSLATLVRALGDVGGRRAVRISSLEPMDCTPEIVELVAGSPRLAPHFHLPLQHGSDDDAARDAAAVHGAALSATGRADSTAACRTPRSAPTSSSAFPGETDDAVRARPSRCCAICR